MTSSDLESTSSQPIAERVAQMDSLEDIFATLRLDFDKHVVRVHRLHILWHFGQQLAAIEAREPPVTEEERLTLYASALLQSHDLFAHGECQFQMLPFPGLKPQLIQLGRKPQPARTASAK